MATSRPTLFGPSLDHAVAGLVAGSFTTLIMHPLDLVKVRFQIADKPNPQTLSSIEKGKGRASGGVVRFGKEVYGAMAEAVKKDGWKGLYRGLGPNVAGNASSWGLYFLW